MTTKNPDPSERSRRAKARRAEARADARKAAPPGQRALVAVLALCTMATTITVGWPVLSAEARTFDDDAFLTHNPLVQNPSWPSVQRFFAEVLEPSTVHGYYLPLSMTSLMLDYAAGGRPENLTPFHRTSLALHALNTGLIVALLYLLFRQPWTAACVGLLYGLHPLTVEPVAWVGERKTVLAAFFAFACLVAYTAHARRGGGWRLAAAAVLYLLAILSKPTAVPLPALLVLIDYWPLHRLNRRAWLEKTPFVLIGVAGVIVTLVSHSRTAGVSAPVASDPAALAAVPLRAGYLIAFYLGKVLWPSPLSTVYPMPDPVSLANAAILIGCLVTLALAVLVFLSRRRTPALAIGGLGFVIALLPTLGLVRYSWVTASDKYLYLPAIGLLLPLAALLAWWWGREPGAIRPRVRRGLILAVIGIVALGEAVMTRRQIAIWATSESLGRHAVAVAPESAPALSNLGIALHLKGRYDEAIELYRRAIEVDPNDALTNNALGDALVQTGKHLDAVGHFLLARRERPDLPFVHNNLGNTQVMLGQNERALESFDQALRLWPEYADAYVSRGHCLSRMNRLDDAIRDYRRALELKPDHLLALNNLGNALLNKRQYQPALDAFNRALAVDPDHADTFSNLGNVWLEMGDVEKGADCYRRALAIEPRLLQAQCNLAEAYRRMGRIDDARTQYAEALKLAESRGDKATASWIREQIEGLGN